MFTITKHKIQTLRINTEKLHVGRSSNDGRTPVMFIIRDVVTLGRESL